jgi:hypothetical protein
MKEENLKMLGDDMINGIKERNVAMDENIYFKFRDLVPTFCEKWLIHFKAHEFFYDFHSKNFLQPLQQNHPPKLTRRNTLKKT